MTNVEEFLQGSSGSSLICLQLKKPKNWNWEISTSKSSPHIALPTIQLFNSKGKLLVETNDNGTTHRQTWNSSSSSFQIGKNSGFLQRSKSDNLEKKLVANNFRSPTLITVSEKISTNKCDTGKNNLHIQRCRSDSIALRTSHQHQHQINKNNLEIPKNYELKKSRSDVIDIKVKPKLFHSASERKKSYNNNYYYRRSQSDDLIQKTKQKYDLEQSRKRAEADGYMKIIQQDLEEKNMRKKCLLATAETVVYHSNNKSATTLEVKEVVKPKKYVLRQSRAGILVLTDDDDETFHSSHLHRKRCHGEYEDCRYDKNDVHIQGELPSLENNFLYTPRRSKSSKEFSRRNVIINNKRNDQHHHHHQEYPKKKSDQTNLFYSKSDIFPFQNVLMNKSNNNKLDENSNYLINEPLTTPDDEIIEEKFGKGPLIRNHQKSSNRSSCDLLQLVRQISSSREKSLPKNLPLSLKEEEEEEKENAANSTTGNINNNNNNKKNHQNQNDDVIKIMGANVSRHSTKGLSGRRSQSSGSICNGKWRHQGDGSGKSSGGSLPSYLDEQSSQNYEEDNDDDDDQDENNPSIHDDDDESRRIPPLGDPGAPLHWKFSDGPTSQQHQQQQQCNQDQGYGSERSPEEEYPSHPSLLLPLSSDHDDDDISMEQCHHHLEAHSCYPFISPESTFLVKLIKGSRGLGLSVTGGIESGGSWPGLVRIKRLFPHQPASACGLLNVGDLLLEANGVPLTGLTNYEALEVLRTATNLVELKICRPPPDVLNCVSPVSDVPPPPPTRREPPNNLNLHHSTSSYYSSTITPEDEYFHGEFEVVLTKIQGSLGFTLRKEDDSALGHYVRALVREPALTDGRIQAGDRIIAVNDVEIYPMTHEQAVQYLRQCGDKVKLRLYRDSPQTPVANNTDVSPTAADEITPRTSFIKKTHLRQEAVDMLNDIAARKLVPSSALMHQQIAARRSLSPNSSPSRRLRRPNCSDASQRDSSFTNNNIRYLLPEDQFHEGIMLNKCSRHYNDEELSLFTVDSSVVDDLERPSRYEPNSLDLYNPNQTPVAARKPRFNFSLAHNAYELNNLDPEVLDAPNLTYTIGNEESKIPEIENVPKEPASMPYIPLNSTSTFSHKNPAYQSAHPQCVETSSTMIVSDVRSTSSSSSNKETDTIKRKKGILKKDSSSISKGAEKNEHNIINKTESMKEEFEILSIELNRGWNSRLGFSLQGAAGVTYVSAVYADSVAAKDGRIKPGDRIIKVNDEDVQHLNTNNIIDLLRIVRGPVCIVIKRIKSNEDCGNKSNAEN